MDVISVNVLKGLLDIIFHRSLKCLFFSDALQHRVEAVLDLVFGAPSYLLGDLRPLVPYLLLFLEQNQIFFRGPSLPSDLRRQEIDPALSALFALSLGVTHAFVDFIGDLLPLFLSALAHKGPQE